MPPVPPSTAPSETEQGSARPVPDGDPGDRILALPLCRREDAATAERAARAAAQALGCPPPDQARFAAVVAELALNALRHAAGGVVELAIDRRPSPLLVVSVVDRGAGTADVAGARPAPSLDATTGTDAGLTAVRLLADTVTVAPMLGGGTRVEAGVTLPGLAGSAAIAAAIADAGDAIALDPGCEADRLHRERLAALVARRAGDEELARASHELDDTNRGVVALYAELDQRAEELKRASELKTRFFSFMSHEFRTPVKSILALSGLLADRVDGDLTTEQAKQVGFIARSAQDLAALVDDLLDLAKVEAGRFEVAPTRFTVGELFGGLKGALRPLLPPGAPVALVFAGDDAVPPLETDAAKLAQILRNLVSNALKFTESGEVRVAVSAEAGMAVFTVSDTGIGIPADRLDGIFREFGQLQTRLSGRSKGTGLGLPLSRKLAALLGGTLDARSEPGCGSTFTLRLPCRWGAGAATEPPADPDPASPPAGDEPRVLLIDDDPAWRYVQRSLLAAWRVQVFEAGNGADGLEVARAIRPRLILLDLSMPLMDGFAAYAALGEDPLLAAIPVVVCSSRTLAPGERERLRGVLAVIDKSTRGAVDDRERLRGLLEQAGIAAADPSAP